jgi:hypothetical protein
LTRANRLVLLVAIFGALSLGAEAYADEFAFSGYDDLLTTYVDDKGLVDYRGLHADGQALNTIADAVGGLAIGADESWSEAAQISFWINAYNLLSLKAVVDHYPIQRSLIGSIQFPGNSIRQISGAWDKLKFDVMRLPMTLDTVEHDVLRARFKEPRIHMALVCGAMGCPPLRREAYTGARLDEQLEDQTKRFLSDPNKFRIDRESSTVYLSSIFSWFGADFVKAYKPEKLFPNTGEVESSVLNFIGKHLPAADREYLERGGYSIEYPSYDWSLNEQK